MQIARGLKSLRSSAQLTQSEVAKRAGVSVGTVNRYETWQDRAKLRIPTVKAIADSCGATPEELATLTDLVRNQENGWWMEHPAVPEVMDPLMSFEDVAAYEHVFANALVPGLLQTPHYALALHEAQEVRTEAQVIANKVDARIRRQAILDRSPALHLWAVLDDAVLRRHVGGPAVMREQIEHLIAMAGRPNVDIQILRFSAGAHAAGSGGHFLLLGRDDEQDPLSSMNVVYLELHRRGLYLDEPTDVHDYKLMFDYLRSQAADTATSLDLLTAARRELTP
ncbi:helix-turn-helix transcriptional regulator [Streptomyces olivaceus]|uniref:helix-turn-helix domain-containing protein n=1 Tax=Streptomyces TaxID=1883 RepID=UPI001CCC66E0|nr:MULTISPECIES: helix-turn-helix transcriptional regulator [Streptomyces]MBZ6142692.1 helix-turn-helix transcriptional regulator [Streptomyces olivaceus]MBZ6170389.1 helix-turn-helix transcriptional regulator [Streptomyces olivaceus]MBZ6176762.1 helix-turn-helix transcriptional regulator [Streptomyces olivaceus]MBZ6182927.1 helix-turn-helix transcriptional regulator [Streptomyces olivaceus]MBZ6260773.1 helix-turn-helix transcriptional regulator [Streptomyces olivaceus]